jgi:hypothetical protein
MGSADGPFEVEGTLDAASPAYTFAGRTPLFTKCKATANVASFRCFLLGQSVGLHAQRMQATQLAFMPIVVCLCCMVILASWERVGLVIVLVSLRHRSIQSCIVLTSFAGDNALWNEDLQAPDHTAERW